MGNWAKGKDSLKANPPNAVIVHLALIPHVNGIHRFPVDLINPLRTVDGWTFDLKDL